MKVHPSDIDSRALGCSVLSISDFDATVSFASFEQDYLAKYSPRYVSCKVPVGDLADIHTLEAAGFRFVEVQITGDIPIRLINLEDQPYRLEKVTTEAILDEVLEIAGTSFDMDRFTKDPEVGPKLGGRRYQEYVRQSFAREDEEVCRLVDPGDGSTLLFRTHRFTAPGKAVALLNAVRVDQKGSGIGIIADSIYYNYLAGLGVTKVTTSFSAEHRLIMQHLIRNLHLKVRATVAILRKVYPNNQPSIP